LWKLCFFFYYSLIKSSKEQHLFEMEIFYNHFNSFLIKVLISHNTNLRVQKISKYKMSLKSFWKYFDTKYDDTSNNLCFEQLIETSNP